MKTSTKYLKITINILTMIMAVCFCLWILPKIIIYFLPFFVAAIIALIANPVVKFLEKRLKIGRKGGTAFVIIAVIAVVVTALYFIVVGLINEIIGLAELAPEIWRKTSATISDFAEQFKHYMSRMPGPVQQWSDNFFNNLGDYLTNWFTNTSLSTGDAAASSSTNAPLVIIGIIMGVLASYFFLAEKDYIVRMMEQFIPASLLGRWDLVFRTMKDAVGGYFIAQLKIMAFVYVILIIGLLILKVKYSFLIALLIAILDFLPFFGTGTVMIPWAVICLIQRNYFMAIGIIITWAVSQLVRQLIQPKLVGASVGLDPIPTLLFLFIGFRLGGAFGLIVAVPVGMIFINLYRAGIFSNFAISIQLLTKDLARLRRFTNEELEAEGIDPQSKKGDKS